MNKRSLLAVLALSWAAQTSLVTPPPAQADGKVSRSASAQARGSAARANGASPWERSYSAEAAGKLEAALNALAELPSAQRGAYVASYRRGWLLYRLGRYAESVAAYHTAVSQEPAAIEARVALLLPLMALTKWNDVAQVADDVLRIDPENYLALSRLALAKFSTQRFAEAEALYRRLLILYPSDIEMRAGLGWTALRMGKQSQALGLFSQVLDVAPSHPSATLGLRQVNGRNADH